MLVSLGCGLHCMALTAAFALYPSLWLSRSLWESGLLRKLFWLELGLLVLAWAMAVAALTAGWFCHRRWPPPVLGLAGLAMITPAILLADLHRAGFLGSGIALTGALVLITAHWLNLRSARRAS